MFLIFRLNPCSCGRWSQRYNIMKQDSLNSIVLILVLVEDGLRVIILNYARTSKSVLILVLVEDGLRGLWQSLENSSIPVLILVLVEDGLREYAKNI